VEGDNVIEPRADLRARAFVDCPDCGTHREAFSSFYDGWPEMKI
jgi:hypothetical protein